MCEPTRLTSKRAATGRGVQSSIDTIAPVEETMEHGSEQISNSTQRVFWSRAEAWGQTSPIQRNTCNCSTSRHPPRIIVHQSSCTQKKSTDQHVSLSHQILMTRLQHWSTVLLFWTKLIRHEEMQPDTDGSENLEHSSSNTISHT